MAGPEVIKCRDCGQEIEFAVFLVNQRRIPIRPSRFDVSKDPHARHAGVEHPVTGRLMIRSLRPGDHVAPDEVLVLLHRYECAKSPMRARNPSTAARAA